MPDGNMPIDEAISLQERTLRERIQLLLSAMSSTDDGPIDTFSSEMLERIASSGLYVVRGSSVLMPDGNATIFSGDSSTTRAVAKEYSANGQIPLSLGPTFWMEDNPTLMVYNDNFQKGHPKNGPVAAPLGNIVVFLERSAGSVRLIERAEMPQEELLKELNDYEEGSRVRDTMRRTLANILRTTPIMAFEVGPDAKVSRIYNRLENYRTLTMQP